MMLGRILPSFAAAVLIAGGTLVAVPGEASAADFCGWQPFRTNWQLATVMKAGAAVHDGPLAKCPIQDRLGAGGTLTNVHCKYINDRYDNLWYWTEEGWVYSPYLELVIDSGVPTCGWPQ
ncbi:hypothetical protein [Streptomyces rubrogriseus]|uniref:SH3 domain-containing protein n=1 Tax=Streptomyces rubrogriseus TaxID=194673 RepID=A0A6G3T7N9_9ACTN|nr:hypothetical protein [Streptomyces rubrogriseus]NEC32749.1 hypothetical protein [Streptomyces rubrogriseus]